MCSVSVNITMTAGGKSTDPSLANPVAMENSPTEKPTKRKKNSFCAFFRKTLLTIKSANQCQHQGNQVAPLQPVSDMDPTDPKCGPSGLEPTACRHLADPQPEPSGLQDHTDPPLGLSSVTPTNFDEKPADPDPQPDLSGLQDNTDPPPGPSSVTPMNCDEKPADPEPQPEPSGLQDHTDPPLSLSSVTPTNYDEKLADPDSQPDPFGLQDHTDPPPGPSSVTPMNCDEKPADPEPAEENQTNTKKKKKHICGFFRRTRRAVKRAKTQRKKHNKVSPLCPLPSDDHQPEPCVPEPMALQDPVDPQPDPADRPEDPKSDLSDSDQDSDEADSFSGPSAFKLEAPKYPGASKHRRIKDGTRFRAACFTDPTPASFDEIYEVGRKIGQGGFGTVYEGISKLLREQVAIKIVPKRDRDRFITIPGCSKPLFAEVALNLLLKRPPLSPYIVHMLEWFEEKDRYILILEHLQPCKDLLKFMLNDIQLLDEAKIRSLMHQVGLAAKHCLDRGIFHRDIKLNNLLINMETNQVKLIDFGCGDLVKPGYVGNFTGGVCPPEYYKDLRYEAGPTTVWSVGFMLYSMVYKRQPFRCLEDLLHVRLRFRHKISTELQDLICRCMTLDPTERATIEQVLQHEWFGLSSDECQE